jgi:tetratricopeptide (TPR) repeat protein
VAFDLIEDEKRATTGVVLGLTAGQMVGFDIRYWMKCLQIRPLVMLGRFSEAEERLARLFQAEQADGELLHQGLPHFVAVELAWFRNDTLAAGWHAREIGRLANRAAVPYWLVLASYCQGLAAATAGEFTEADGFFQQALGAARRGKAALEFEARMLAYQADNLMRAGNSSRAGEVAAEAIGVARRKADRLGECHASLVMAKACLTQSGSQDTEQARRLLERANVLVDQTGAKAFEPMMLRVGTEVSDTKNRGSPRP